MENREILNPIQAPNTPVPETSKSSFGNWALLVLGTVTVVFLGVGTGWLLSGKAGGSSLKKAPPALVAKQGEAGILDESKFRGDTAEGVLREGGINGDGTHHLEREGDKSQTVYLVSTVIDLQPFVNKKVKIWGETQSVKKAGWFMDVVKIKVIE